MQKILLFILMFALINAQAFAELPEPPESGVNMVLGEQTGDYYADVELFYESGNGMELTAVTRTLYVPEGETIIEAALDELFKPVEGQEFISPMPGAASIRSISYGCGLVTVDLTINVAGLQNEGELVSVLMAITNTLTGIEGVEYVNILVNSRQEGVSSIPTGLLTEYNLSASAAWARYQAEAASFLESRMPMERTVALYFPSVNGQWLLPEIRQVTFESDDYATELMNELMAGAGDSGAYVDFLSGGVGILTEAPEITVSAAGERVLDIRLSGTLRDYLVLQGVPEWQLAGAVTMTMCSFIPELDAVRITIGDEVIERLNMRGLYHDFEDGLMYRSSFSMYAGSASTLYFSNGADGLCAVERSVSAERAMSPCTLITQLISGPSSSETGVYAVMPAGVTAADLLGVAVEDGVASVNMSVNFYRLCQMLNEDEERLMVYSIVNTLCSLPGISAVSILIEGEQIQSLSNSIYMMSELLPNPGIIK